MQPIELTIRLTAAGKVEVTGPIEQRLLCYGLLEVARDVIGAHQPLEQRIVQPSLSQQLVDDAKRLGLVSKGNGHG